MLINDGIMEIKPNEIMDYTFYRVIHSLKYCNIAKQEMPIYGSNREINMEGKDVVKDEEYPCSISWKKGGIGVFVSGDFNNWKLTALHRRYFNFNLVLMILKSIYP
jgi:hypothetical protein